MSPTCNKLSTSVAPSGRSYLTIALLVCATGACVGATAPPSATSDVDPVEPTSSRGGRFVRLDEGSYVELRPGIEAGFAHCCGDDQLRLEIECSDGLVRCYRQAGDEWKQTYGKHCKRGLDQQCYEQTCARVCEAYWEIGPTRWHEIIPK